MTTKKTTKSKKLGLIFGHKLGDMAHAVNKMETLGYEPVLVTWDRYKDNHSCNVGVLAGKYDSMMDLLLLNYMVSQSGNTNHFTDQSSFNFIVHNSIAKDAVQITGIDESLALQLGTMDNENLIGERKNNIDEFTIIHQYDRVPDINEYVTKLLS